MAREQDRYSSILIVLPGRLGDIAMGLPLLASLRDRFPDAFIGWVVERRFAGLLEGHPALDRLYVFDRPTGARGLGRLTTAPRLWSALADLRRGLGERRWDAAIVVQSRLLTGLVGRLSGAAVRVVFASKRKRLHWLFGNRQVRAVGKHMVERFLELGAALGASTLCPRFGLQPSAEGAAWAETALAGLGRPLVAVIPGASKPDKVWPVECFAETIGAVRKQLGACGVVALGGAAERGLGQRLAELVGEDAANLAGATSIPQLVGALAACDVVLSGDTGPAHVAAALGRPVVAVFAVTDPTVCGPWGDGHTAIVSESSRIEDIPVARVASAVLAALGRR